MQAGGKASALYLALKACGQSKNTTLRMEAQWAEGILLRSFTEDYDSVGGWEWKKKPLKIKNNVKKSFSCGLLCPWDVLQEQDYDPDYDPVDGWEWGVRVLAYAGIWTLSCLICCLLVCLLFSDGLAGLQQLGRSRPLTWREIHSWEAQVYWRTRRMLTSNETTVFKPKRAKPQSVVLS